MTHEIKARATDPETSREAAADFGQNKAQRSVATVVAILRERGPLTDFEIREWWGAFWGSNEWSFTLPSKARHWARLAGLVKHDGFGVHEGRKVRRWAIGRDSLPSDTTGSPLARARERIVWLEQECARLHTELAAQEAKLAKWGRPPNAKRQARALAAKGEPCLL